MDWMTHSILHNHHCCPRLRLWSARRSRRPWRRASHTSGWPRTRPNSWWGSYSSLTSSLSLTGGRPAGQAEEQPDQQQGSGDQAWRAWAGDQAVYWWAGERGSRWLLHSGERQGAWELHYSNQELGLRKKADKNKELLQAHQSKAQVGRAVWQAETEQGKTWCIIQSTSLAPAHVWLGIQHVHSTVGRSTAVNQLGQYFLVSLFVRFCPNVLSREV